MGLGCFWLLFRSGSDSQLYLQPLKHSESQGERGTVADSERQSHKDFTATKELQALLLVDSSSGAQIHLCSS